jgi:hypothetical protein
MFFEDFKLPGCGDHTQKFYLERVGRILYLASAKIIFSIVLQNNEMFKRNYLLKLLKVKITFRKFSLHLSLKIILSFCSYP